jgi:hypothetical protein
MKVEMKKELVLMNIMNSIYYKEIKSYRIFLILIS